MSNIFEAWKSEHTADLVEVPVCFDRALLVELERAQKDLAVHQAARQSAVSTPMLGEVDEREAELKAQVEDLEQRVEDGSHIFIFTSIGRGPWRELTGKHPPTEEQKEKFGRGLDHNPDTFPAAAMAVTCVDPGITIEQAQWFLDTFPIGEVDRVWAAVLNANVVGADPLGDTASRLAGAKRSTPQ